ncbi:LamG domain-containing protein, partial [Rathayibacter sp. VKM Ac-2630]|uniref:LamG domain-containing protein n=1 Tax=Rathayibacter sp. VKM Ac-2630 TaxID=1938617 RepID=UPI0009C79C3E
AHLGGIVLAVNAEGVLRMGGSNTGISGGTVIPGRWYVFAITHTGTTATVNFADTLTTATNLSRGTNPGYSSLGAAPDGSSPLFGALREISFYPTVHTAEARESTIAALRSWYTAG